MRSLPLVARVARLLADRRDQTRHRLTVRGEAYAGLMDALDEPRARGEAHSVERLGGR